MCKTSNIFCSVPQHTESVVAALVDNIVPNENVWCRETKARALEYRLGWVGVPLTPDTQGLGSRAWSRYKGLGIRLGFRSLLWHLNVWHNLSEPQSIHLLNGSGNRILFSVGHSGNTMK